MLNVQCEWFACSLNTHSSNISQSRPHTRTHHSRNYRIRQFQYYKVFSHRQNWLMLIKSIWTMSRSIVWMGPQCRVSPTPQQPSYTFSAEKMRNTRLVATPLFRFTCSNPIHANFRIVCCVRQWISVFAWLDSIHISYVHESCDCGGNGRRTVWSLQQKYEDFFFFWKCNRYFSVRHWHRIRDQNTYRLSTPFNSGQLASIAANSHLFFIIVVNENAFALAMQMDARVDFSMSNNANIIKSLFDQFANKQK